MSKYDEAYEKGFDTPVGMRIWTLIGEKLESLKYMIHNSGILKSVVSEGKTLNSYIIDAYKSFTDTEIENRFLKVREITPHLEKAESIVIEWLIRNAFHKVSTFKTEIRECVLLVGIYSHYNTEIFNYVKKIGKNERDWTWKFCPLSQKLQKTFGNKASLICEHLGATLEKHLAYVDIKDILGDATDTTRQGLSFLTLKEKLKLQEMVQEYQLKTKNDLPVKTVTPIRASLAELRTCFESSDTEE